MGARNHFECTVAGCKSLRFSRSTAPQGDGMLCNLDVRHCFESSLEYVIARHDLPLLTRSTALQGDGALHYGCFILNGRLKGDMKSTLRRVIEEYNLSVRLTPNQNLILCDVQPAWRDACPALPLCGLAIGEAERGLPDINKRVRRMLDKLGLEGETVVMRMTGCANGCARPYMAELGFVGDGPNSYQVWLGGNRAQTAMAQEYKERVKVRRRAPACEGRRVCSCAVWFCTCRVALRRLAVLHGPLPLEPILSRTLCAMRFALMLQCNALARVAAS
jgi:hypothetical protein